MKIIYSPKFISEYKKLPRNIKLLAGKKDKLFRKNPFNPKLKIHKLAGKFKDYWAFSIDYKHRVIFKFMDKSTSWFLSIGTHDIYKN